MRAGYYGLLVALTLVLVGVGAFRAGSRWRGLGSLPHREPFLFFDWGGHSERENLTSMRAAPGPDTRLGPWIHSAEGFAPDRPGACAGRCASGLNRAALAEARALRLLGGEDVR